MTLSLCGRARRRSLLAHRARGPCRGDSADRPLLPRAGLAPCGGSERTGQQVRSRPPRTAAPDPAAPGRASAAGRDPAPARRPRSRRDPRPGRRSRATAATGFGARLPAHGPRDPGAGSHATDTARRPGRRCRTCQRHVQRGPGRTTDERAPPSNAPSGSGSCSRPMSSSISADRCRAPRTNRSTAS